MKASRGVALSLLLFSAQSFAADAAVPAGRYRFDIEAGPADPQLQAFIVQSGVQLVYRMGDVETLNLRAVQGMHSPLEALKQMLAGSGLTYLASGSVVNVIPAPPSASSSHPKRVAREKPPRRPPDAPVREAEMEEVNITTGRSSPVGSVAMSIERGSIDMEDRMSVAEALKTLPQVFGGGPTEDTNFIGYEAPTNTAHGTGINIRGLGAGSTLVLYGGRRAAPGGTDGAFVDVSNLPMVAIYRMEILTDSSATFFGADAAGGVVNFVLRSPFDGSETTANYGAATRGHLQESYFSHVISEVGERASGLVALDYYSRDALPTADRSQARSDLRPWGGSNFNIPQSNPGNVIVGGTTCAVPAGQDGTALQPSDFDCTTQNLQNRFEGADLLPSQQRLGFFGTGKYRVSDSLLLFGDVILGERNMRMAGSGQPAQLTVTPTNPYYVNPTGGSGPIIVNYNFLEDLDNLLASARVSTRFMNSGLDLQLDGGWKVRATAGYTSERIDHRLQNTVDQVALWQALADSNPATAFNPFGAGSSTTAATREAIRAEAQFETMSSLRSAEVVATGPVATLPGGAINLSVGAEHREQRFRSEHRATESRMDARRSINSAFLEVEVPIIGEANSFRGMRALTISLAERVERYSDFGHTVAARFGLQYEPWEGLKFRSSYSESFRPPGPRDLDESSNNAAIITVPDARHAPTNVLVWLGKNRLLHEEKALSWTAGVEYAPPESGFFAALTYFETKFIDRLNQPAPTMSLLTDEAMSSLITFNPSAQYRADVCSRAPQTASMSACLNAPIAAIGDLRLRNDARMKTRGFDTSVHYALPTDFGEFAVRVIGTYILEFSEAKSATLPFENRVSTPNYPVNLRARVTGEYRLGGFELGLGVSYTNSYRDTVSIPRRHVSSWTTVDLRAEYTFNRDRSSLGGTTVSLAIDDALDSNPPFLNNAVGIGYDQENSDLLGRMVSFTVRKKW